MDLKEIMRLPHLCLEENISLTDKIFKLHWLNHKRMLIYAEVVGYT